MISTGQSFRLVVGNFDCIANYETGPTVRTVALLKVRKL